MKKVTVLGAGSWGTALAMYCQKIVLMLYYGLYLAHNAKKLIIIKLI